MIALIPQILSAIAAIPKIGELVMQACGAIAAWYCARQKGETLREISDAAAFAARANTDEERFLACEHWRRALSRERVQN